MKRLVVIAGSGRSGTSIMAATMGQLAFHLPQPEVQPDETNPKGFGEPRWVVDFHNKLLRNANIQVSDARPDAWVLAAKACLDEKSFATLEAWLDEQFAISDQLVVKDPRLIWLLPLWERVCTSLDGQLDVVTMLRHPAEVVHSKRTTSEINRLAGWVNTMLFTERGTRDRRRVFVQFDDMLDDWTKQIGRVSADLDAPSLVQASAEDQMRADTFIDRTLHRTKATWQDVHAPKELVELADGIWTDLLLLAAGKDMGGATERLDRHREHYVTLYEQAEAIAESSRLAEVRPLKRQITRLRRENQRRGNRRAKVQPGARARVKRAVRLIPPGVRRRVPLRLRQNILRAFRR